MTQTDTFTDPKLRAFSASAEMAGSSTRIEVGQARTYVQISGPRVANKVDVKRQPTKKATHSGGAVGARTEKIAALKAAIENGTYRIPAADLAERIICTWAREPQKG